jgi:hypothetical protein
MLTYFCRGVVRQNGLQDAPVQMMSFAASNQHATTTCEHMYCVLKIATFFLESFCLEFHAASRKAPFQWTPLPAAKVDYY